ncbi:MAG: hypothetical protein JNL77_08770 [Nitrosomonas sp.]|nr:hypothetical protein [Nitrosomonas sp.]
MIDIIPKINDIFSLVKNLAGTVEKYHSHTKEEEFRTIREQAIQLEKGVSSLKEEALTLKDEIRDLVDKFDELQDIIHELSNLEIRAVAPGAFAYVRKNAPTDSKNSAWYCQTCLDNRKHKSIYNRDKRNPGVDIYMCHQCGSKILIPNDISNLSQVARMPGKWDDFI